MSEEKNKDNGFLFNVVSNIGDGHQIQAAFNLPKGATKEEIDSVTDLFFGAVKRQAARLRVPTIEMEVARQTALIEGVKASVARLDEAPKLNGKRQTATEAQYQQALSQLDADKAKLEIFKKNLELTLLEAEVKGSEWPTQLASS